MCTPGSRRSDQTPSHLVMWLGEGGPERSALLLHSAQPAPSGQAKSTRSPCVNTSRHLGKQNYIFHSNEIPLQGVFPEIYALHRDSAAFTNRLEQEVFAQCHEKKKVSKRRNQSKESPGRSMFKINNF